MSGPAESPWRIRAGALAVVAVGAAAYASSFAGAYVYDDVHNLVDNPHLSPLWPPGGWLWARPGFGLAGHALGMARSSGVGMLIRCGALPGYLPSFRISCAALRPGRPETPPPGWVLAPHRYTPATGAR